MTVVVAAKGYPGTPAKGAGITGIESAEASEGVTVFHAGTAIADGRLVASGGRVLAVTAIGRQSGAGAGSRLSGDRPDRVRRRLLPQRHRLEGIGAAGMNRTSILALGIAAVIGATWVWHGPLGAGDRFAAGVDERGRGPCSTIMRCGMSRHGWNAGR